MRERLPLNSLWYAVPETSFGTQKLSANQPGVYRTRGLRRNINGLFQAAGLSPLSPHKFRHGYAVYGLKLAKEVSNLKTASMNHITPAKTLTGNKLFTLSSGCGAV